MKPRRGGTPRAAACLPAAALLAAALLTADALLARCGQGAGTATRAAITISSYFPPTIDGRNFHPGEHVVLRAQPRLGGLKPFYFKVHARSDGTFVVRLHGYGIDRCTGFTVTATGSRGSHAVVRTPQFGCPPVQSPATP